MTQVAPPEAEQNLMEISMGPQHPSTHGVFRMDVRLDGERVMRLKPVFGYLPIGWIISAP
jgi:NADH-quinone oxidoreductase subunit D